MTSEDSNTVVLNAKIEWYREILQIEPNSKLFLPFARHLAKVGAAENNPQLLNEAFDVLRQGLIFHPDYMEARLFLIELLNACDCKSQCGAEVARLASLFLSYPDFWDAWREHAISENESADFTVALGFMGAILKDKSVSILQVLEAGLDSLRISPRMTFAKKHITPQANTGHTVSAPFVSQEIITKIPESLINKHSAEVLEKTSVKHIPTNEEFKEQITQESDFVCTAVANAVLESALLSEHAVLDEGGAKIAGNIADIADIEGILPVTESRLPEASTLKTQQGMAQESRLDLLEDAHEMPVEIATSVAHEVVHVAPISLEPDTFEPSALENTIMQDLQSPEDDDELFMKEHLATYQDYAKKHVEEPQNAKEALSALLADSSIVVQPMDKAIFKTRSMADILAEQGDLHGAIEIYQELILKADDEERPLLEDHLKDLQDLAGIKPVDLSKLLAIDDMVDTSFGLLSQEENAEHNTETNDLKNEYSEKIIENNALSQDLPQDLPQASLLDVTLDSDVFELESTSFEENRDMEISEESSAIVSMDLLEQSEEIKAFESEVSIKTDKLTIEEIAGDSVQAFAEETDSTDSLVLDELTSTQVPIDVNDIDHTHFSQEENRQESHLLELPVEEVFEPSSSEITPIDFDTQDMVAQDSNMENLDFDVQTHNMADESLTANDLSENIEEIDQPVSEDLENILNKFAKIEQEARSDLQASLKQSQGVKKTNKNTFDTPLDVSKISLSQDNIPIQEEISVQNEAQGILENDVIKNDTLSATTILEMERETESIDLDQSISSAIQIPVERETKPSSATKDTENVVNLLSKLAERLEAKGTL